MYPDTQSAHICTVVCKCINIYKYTNTCRRISKSIGSGIPCSISIGAFCVWNWYCNAYVYCRIDLYCKMHLCCNTHTYQYVISKSIGSDIHVPFPRAFSDFEYIDMHWVNSFLRHMLICTHLHTYIHIDTQTQTRTTHTRTHPHTHVHVHMLVHTHTHTHTNTHTHTHTHTYLHTHLHTCMHTHLKAGTRAHPHTFTHAHTHNENTREKTLTEI